MPDSEMFYFGIEWEASGLRDRSADPSEETVSRAMDRASARLVTESPVIAALVGNTPKGKTTEGLLGGLFSTGEFRVSVSVSLPAVPVRTTARGNAREVAELLGILLREEVAAHGHEPLRLRVVQD